MSLQESFGSPEMNRRKHWRLLPYGIVLNVNDLQDSRREIGLLVCEHPCALGAPKKSRMKWALKRAT